MNEIPYNISNQVFPNSEGIVPVNEFPETVLQRERKKRKEKKKKEKKRKEKKKKRRKEKKRKEKKRKVERRKSVKMERNENM